MKNKMKITKKTVKASSDRKPIRKAIKAATSSDMLSVIYTNKDFYIGRFQDDYNGEPATSWDNIFDNVVAEFEAYAGDEASSIEGGYTVEEAFDEGIYDANDVDSVFDQFVMWLDLNEYDY